MDDKAFKEFVRSYVRLHEFSFCYFGLDDDEDKNRLLYEDTDQLQDIICEAMSICTEVMWRLEAQCSVEQRKKLQKRVDLERALHRRDVYLDMQAEEEEETKEEKIARLQKALADIMEED